jgi:hypothetical protein
LQEFFKVPAKVPKPVLRRLRADAQRNHERILEIATDAFTRSGANINLDALTRDAGVGPGTLYRHLRFIGARQKSWRRQSGDLRRLCPD